MARVKRAVHSKKKHQAVLERAQGYYGNKSRSYKSANEAGDARRLRTRSATAGPARATSGRSGSSGSTRRAARTAPATAGSSPGLRLAEIEVDRKVLADLAVHEPAAFTRARPGGHRGPGQGERLTDGRAEPDRPRHPSVQRLRRLSGRRAARRRRVLRHRRPHAARRGARGRRGGRGGLHQRRARRGGRRGGGAGVACERSPPTCWPGPPTP